MNSCHEEGLNPVGIMLGKQRDIS
eukprot:gene27296-biopygen17807